MYLYYKCSINKRSNNNLNNNDDIDIYLISSSHNRSVSQNGWCLLAQFCNEKCSHFRNHLLMNEMVIVCVYIQLSLGCGMEAELSIAVDNGLSFESVLICMWKIEMNRHHVQKFNLHFTGETLPGEYYVWKHGNIGGLL